MSVDIQYLIEKKDMIVVFDGLIDPTVCDRLIAELRPIWNTISNDGETAGGVMPLTKSSRDSVLSESMMGDYWNNTFAIIENKIFNGLTAAVSWYRAEFDALHTWQKIEDSGFQLQQYPQHGGFYREHVDSLPAYPSSNRVLGCIVYLNTVEVGGETHFPMHGASVKSVSGRIALFPATFTHPHAGRPALTEDKWIISTFLCNSLNDPQDPHTPTHDEHDAPHTHDEHDAPHTHFDDAFSHPPDEHDGHTHDEHGTIKAQPTKYNELDWEETAHLGLGGV